MRKKLIARRVNTPSASGPRRRRRASRRSMRRKLGMETSMPRSVTA
jgi:hypothetical protein